MSDSKPKKEKEFRVREALHSEYEKVAKLELKNRMASGS